jgi:hypothetical protein
MWSLAAVAYVLLAVLALRGVLWAYVSYIVLGLAYFPVKVGFRLDPHACELTFGARLAVFSLTNYAHIVMFAFFFIMTSAQFDRSKWSEGSVRVRAALIALAMGALVELAEGITGRGHCRLRDIIPDSAGIVLGMAAIALWHTARSRIRRSVPATGN